MVNVIIGLQVPLTGHKVDAVLLLSHFGRIPAQDGLVGGAVQHLQKLPVIPGPGQSAQGIGAPALQMAGMGKVIVPLAAGADISQEVDDLLDLLPEKQKAVKVALPGGVVPDEPYILLVPQAAQRGLQLSPVHPVLVQPGQHIPVVGAGLKIGRHLRHPRHFDHGVKIRGGQALAVHGPGLGGDGIVGVGHTITCRYIY